MTYQQAGRIAILKRVAGWAIFFARAVVDRDFSAGLYVQAQ
ncbi:hypothetical protein OJE16_18290 [Pantoea tagorei]